MVNASKDFRKVVIGIKPIKFKLTNLRDVAL